MAAHLVCLFWGSLKPGELVHQDCDVVAVCGCQRVNPEIELPAICPCECQTCKRAWWAMGRPRAIFGKVFRERDFAKPPGHRPS